MAEDHIGLEFLESEMDNHGCSIVKHLGDIERSPYCASAFRWACTWVGSGLRREEPLFIPLINTVIAFITTPFSREQKERMNRRLGQPCTCSTLVRIYHKASDELPWHEETSSPLSSVMAAVWWLVALFFELRSEESSPLYQRFQATFKQQVKTNTTRVMNAFLAWIDEKDCVHSPLSVLSQLFTVSSTMRRSFLTTPALRDVIFEILEEELLKGPNHVTRTAGAITIVLTVLGHYSNLDKYSFFLFQSGCHSLPDANRRYHLVGKLLELWVDMQFSVCGGLANLAKICHAHMSLEYSPYQTAIDKFANPKLFQVQTELDYEELEDATAYNLISLYVQYSEKFGSMCHHVLGHTQRPWALHDVKVCARCGVTRYCSQACQKGDWEMHKVVCRRFREGKEMIRSEPPAEEEERYDEWNQVIDEWEENIYDEEFEDIFFYTTAIRAQISYKC